MLKIIFQDKKQTMIGISHKNFCFYMIHTSTTRKPKYFKTPSNPQVKGYSQSSLGSVVMPPAMRKMYERVFPKLVDLCSYNFHINNLFSHQVWDEADYVVPPAENG